MRIGQGFDAHRLVADRPLWLGGIEIPFELGLAGHSDGDVLLHAVASALLGAIGRGDLGRHFPSSDPAWAGVASAEIVERVLAQVRASGYRVVQLDATVIAERPRLAPFVERMEERLRRLLGLEPEAVNLKVTSTDGLGAIGRGEGIAALALVALEAAGPPSG